MPDLAGELRIRLDSSLKLVASIEQLRASFRPGSREAVLLHQSRVDAAYEAAFLRIFVAWEDFQESAFVRFLCGYETPGRHITVLLKPKCGDITNATMTMLMGQNYFLWHNPDKVINRSKVFFSTGRHESVLSSAIARLKWFGSIRHRIAHGQDDAIRNFNLATMGLCGRRYRGASAAAFLRDWDLNATTKSRWIESIADELHALAGQIVA